MSSDKLIFNNTYKSGRISYVAFKEKEHFTAVCLEFDLIARENSMEEAIEAIQEYAKMWLENVVEKKLSEGLLNKPAPKKYWDKQKQILKEAEKQKKRTKPRKPATAILQTYPSAFAHC